MTCRGHAAQLGRIYPELKSRETDVLLIGGGTAAGAAGLARALKLPFPVLADPDRAVYDRFGLDKVLFIQRSATVLVDKKRVIRYILRATNPRSSFDKD
jgi:peroxiredoxin